MPDRCGTVLANGSGRAYRAADGDAWAEGCHGDREVGPAPSDASYVGWTLRKNTTYFGSRLNVSSNCYRTQVNTPSIKGYSRLGYFCRAYYRCLRRGTASFIQASCGSPRRVFFDDSKSHCLRGPGGYSDRTQSPWLLPLSQVTRSGGGRAC